ncbi:MAG: hypothetical protein AAGB11_06765 [Pseudomonadota bacterium]
MWEAFEERAAILEFDAGLTRTEAERRAAKDIGYPDANTYRAAISAALPLLLGSHGTA